MRKIWKYRLPLDGYTYDPKSNAAVYEVELPHTAQLLCVTEQHNQPVLYALVDPENSSTQYTIFAYGTGISGPFESGEMYLGTTMHDDSTLVLHWFE